VTAILGSIVGEIPRSRIGGVLSRLTAGQSLRIAILSEGLDRLDKLRMLELADQIGDSAKPAFVAGVLDLLYSRDEQKPAEPEVVWTGPRSGDAFEHVPTVVAARRIIASAKCRLLIAGYQISAKTLEALGVWDAIDRGVKVEAIANSKDLIPSDYQVMVAKGVRVHRATPSSAGIAKFHAKVLVGDGTACIVGSANFTASGHGSNIELGLYVLGEAAAAVERTLDAYLRTASSTGWIITS
jgi:phosphatidylserine/phosphatidylglycerophosphate/cardiolipin synthase-like enzyme